MGGCTGHSKDGGLEAFMVSRTQVVVIFVALPDPEIVEID